MELFTSLLARLASPSLINGVIAFGTGAISTYSTSGVVMPAFLHARAPRRPAGRRRSAGDCRLDLSDRRRDVRALDVGALAVAAVSDQQQSRELFRHLDLGAVDDHHRCGGVSTLRRCAGTSVATDYTGNTDRVCESSKFRGRPLVARTSVASEPRDRSTPSPAARESACGGVRGAKPLGKTRETLDPHRRVCSS